MLKIREIEKKPGVVSLYTVFFDTGEKCVVHSGTLRKLKLKAGQERPAQVLLETIREAEKTEARESAIRSLASKGRTEVQIRRTLQLKEFDKTVVEFVIEWLKSHGLLEEDLLLQDSVEALLKKNGQRVVKQKLISQGFDREKIEWAMKEHVDPEQVRNNLVELARKKGPYYQNKDPKRWKERLGAWLYSKGHSMEDIRYALDRCVKDDTYF